MYLPAKISGKIDDRKYVSSDHRSEHGCLQRFQQQMHSNKLPKD